MATEWQLWPPEDAQSSTPLGVQPHYAETFGHARLAGFAQPPSASTSLAVVSRVAHRLP